jgi:hypothetical protein
MVKKWVLGLVLATLVVGGIFAQEARASEPKNWISGTVGLINGGVGYERTLMPILGVGGEVFYTSFFFLFTTVAAEGFAKWYPFKGTFYVKLGLGFGSSPSLEGDGENPGFLVDPAIGWKIDVGRSGGFFIEPKLGLPIVIGKEIIANPLIGFGMGYCF